ncbi:zinc finger protein 346 [Parasteatoda tepidariorum]|uniref:zinc finger protein 346 n=1 Tax=Parasteatoda tepidariorum TaxID=114398 RepID=UPI00077F8B29|nr:zinc finger protein 346 [Parasteatoda tepidariorum]XP_042909240.1 zinc finger protein 346 [Parasteatoda tepidariorum]
MNCEICNKSFTGIECYQQHVASDKHKRKVSLHNSSMSTESVAATASFSEIQHVDTNTFPCLSCAINFQTLSEFIKHTGSKEHALMILREKDTNANVEDCDSTSNLRSSTDLLKKNNFEAITSWKPRCEKCDKNFSGPESYQQHIDSFEHKRKCGLIATVEIPVNVPLATHCTLSCEPCGVTLSGPIPYQDHMRSKGHKKKVLASSYKFNENSKENCNSDSVDNAPDVELSKKTSCIVSSLAWYCELCDVRCSGLDPYQAHVKGKGHSKKMIRKEAVSKQNELQSLLLGQASSLGSSAQASGQFMSPSQVDGRSGSENTVTGDLGEEVKKSLYGEDWDVKISTPSTLNLTFFAVGEKVDFNKNSKTQIEVKDLDMIDVKEEEEENEEMEE